MRPKIRPGKSVSKARFLELKLIHFILISILILILPVVKEWHTLLYGQRLQGEVVAYKQFDVSGELDSNGPVVRSEIQLLDSDKIYFIYGPENTKFKLGKQLPVILSKKKPGEFIIATFSGFYLHKRSVSLIIVLTIWLAIYSTIVQYQKGTLIQRKKRA